MCVFELTNSLSPTEDDFIKDAKTYGGWKNMLRKRIFKNLAPKDSRRGLEQTTAGQFISESPARESRWMVN